MTAPYDRAIFLISDDTLISLKMEARAFKEPINAAAAAEDMRRWLAKHVGTTFYRELRRAFVTDFVNSRDMNAANQ